MTAHTSINSLEFARKSSEIHDTIAVFDFPRLKELVFSAEDELRFSLVGSVNANGEPELRLRVAGDLHLVCQRCLGSLAYPLEAEARFILVPGEEDLPEPEDERDDVEYMVADPQLDLVALVEDEVLLSLPLSPVHEDAGCNRALSSAQEQKESPFKVLQGLKLNKE